MNLSNMSIAELRDLEEKTKREIKKREGEELSRARDEIMSIAQKLGVPLKHILATQGKVKTGKTATQYQHPDNAALHWSGRGRKPGWIKEWLDAGNALESLRG